MQKDLVSHLREVESGIRQENPRNGGYHPEIKKDRNFPKAFDSFTSRYAYSFNFSQQLEEGEHNVLSNYLVEDAPLEIRKLKRDSTPRPVKQIRVIDLEELSRNAGSKRTTTSPRNNAKTPTSKQSKQVGKQVDVFSAAWLNQSVDFEEGAEVINNNLMEYRGDLKVDTSTEESVIQFSAENERASLLVSGVGTLYNPTILGSFVDVRNAVYVFNTNCNKR